MDRVDILIDGSNFYYLALKKLGLRATDFDFEKFANFLADGRTIAEKGKRFYTGTVREKEGDIRTKKSNGRTNIPFYFFRQKSLGEQKKR